MSGIIERYRAFLPLPEAAAPVSLDEGDTPLILLDRLRRRLGLTVPLYAKVEGFNPTGSFKDRGMTVAVTWARFQKRQGVICASTGNTAASAAAYAARGGLAALVVLPAGAVAVGKLSQAVIHGAVVAAVDGTFDDALDVVRELVSLPGMSLELVNSVNPLRIEGQKTAAFEVCDQLERFPEYLALPVGNAGNITAYWRGFREYEQARPALSAHPLPRMLGFQAAGAAPIVHGRPVTHPETVATAIRIGSPASWKGAVAARDESGGLIEAVDDAAILAAQALLAREEGIFCEPASAAPIAGVARLAEAGYFAGASGPVVCVLTGNGLKDPDAVADRVAQAVVKVPARREALMELFQQVVAGRQTAAVEMEQAAPGRPGR